MIDDVRPSTPTYHLWAFQQIFAMTLKTRAETHVWNLFTHYVVRSEKTEIKLENLCDVCCANTKENQRERKGK